MRERGSISIPGSPNSDSATSTAGHVPRGGAVRASEDPKAFLMRSLPEGGPLEAGLGASVPQFLLLQGQADNLVTLRLQPNTVWEGHRAVGMPQSSCYKIGRHFVRRSNS